MAEQVRIAKTDQGKPLVGWLVWWTVPERLSVPYAELEKLAEDTGYPKTYLPRRPADKNLWRKATQLGTRGVEVEPPQAKVDEVKRQYDVAPQVRVFTRIVSEKEPTLIRHLVRQVTIPTARRKKKQLALDSVAVLEWDREEGTRVRKYKDTKGFLRPEDLDRILADIESRYEHLQTHADAQLVREALRRRLRALYQVILRSSGGVYFIPEGADPDGEKVAALRAFITGLKPWVEGDGEPSCMYVRLLRVDGDTVEDVRKAAIEVYGKALEGLIDKVRPVLDDKAKGKTAAQIAKSALEELIRLQEGIRLAEEALQEGFETLENMVIMARNAVLRAQDKIEA